MDKEVKYQLRRGEGSLKWYKYFTPGFTTYKTKDDVKKALDLCFKVIRIDKITGDKFYWDGDFWMPITKLSR